MKTESEGEMRKKNLGYRIWRIFSPLVVQQVVAWGIQSIIVVAFYLKQGTELMQSMNSKEEMLEKTLELSGELMKYLTEITALSALIMIPILIWMFQKDRIAEKMQGIVPNRKAPLWKYSMIIGICVPFTLGVNNLLLLSSLPQLSEGYQQASEVLYTPSFPVQIICIGIIIPVMEELIFRGLIYKRFRENASAMRSIIYSALLFGLYHGNMVQFIYGVLAGVLLAYLYEKFGSLKAPVLAHIVINIVSCVMTEIDGFVWLFRQPMRMGIVTVICAAVASSMFVLIRGIQEKPEDS